jgi:hypothetical protein
VRSDPLSLEFVVSCRNRYFKRRFIFYTSDEKGVWRILKRFKENGNIFHSVEVFYYLKDGTLKIKELDKLAIGRLNEQEFMRFLVHNVKGFRYEEVIQ